MEMEVNVMMKACSKCGDVKKVVEFDRNKANKDGFNGRCKSCIREYQIKYRELNPEKIKKNAAIYRHKNTEKIKEKMKCLRVVNAENLKEYNKQYRARNHDRIIQLKRKWQENNRDRVNTGNRKYKKENYEKTLQYKANYNNANRKQINEKNINRYRHNCENLGDVYINSLLRQGGLSTEQIYENSELIELKRNIIKLKRELSHEKTN